MNTVTAIFSATVRQTTIMSQQKIDQNVSAKKSSIETFPYTFLNLSLCYILFPHLCFFNGYSFIHRYCVAKPIYFLSHCSKYYISLSILLCFHSCDISVICPRSVSKLAVTAFSSL